MEFSTVVGNSCFLYNGTTRKGPWEGNKSGTRAVEGQKVFATNKTLMPSERVAGTFLISSFLCPRALVHIRQRRRRPPHQRPMNKKSSTLGYSTIRLHPAEVECQSTTTTRTSTKVRGPTDVLNCLQSIKYDPHLVPPNSPSRPLVLLGPCSVVLQTLIHHRNND